MKVPGWEATPNAALVVQATDRGLAPEQIAATPNPYAAWESFATTSVSALWDFKCDSHAAPPVVGDQTFPIALSWFSEHQNWFTKPHHDYPAADIPVPEGTTIYAVTSGTAVSSPVGGDCGNGVIIQSADGVQWGYCHGVKPLVPQGAQVSAGTPIMISGNTGNSDGAHLHLQIRLPSDVYVCPQSALVGWANGQTVNPFDLPRTGCSY